MELVDRLLKSEDSGYHCSYAAMWLYRRRSCQRVLYQRYPMTAFCNNRKFSQANIATFLEKVDFQSQTLSYNKWR